MTPSRKQFVKSIFCRSLYLDTRKWDHFLTSMTIDNRGDTRRRDDTLVPTCAGWYWMAVGLSTIAHNVADAVPEEPFPPARVSQARKHNLRTLANCPPHRTTHTPATRRACVMTDPARATSRHLRRSKPRGSLTFQLFSISTTCRGFVPRRKCALEMHAGILHNDSVNGL